MTPEPLAAPRPPRAAPRLDRLARLGSTSHGVWTRAESLEVLSRGRVDRLLASGIWRAPWPGVHTDAGVPLDASARAVAAVLASGGLARPGPGTAGTAGPAACGLTAARSHGLPLVDDDDPATGSVDVLVDDVHVPQSRRRLVVPQRDGGPPRVLRRHQLTLLEGDLVQHPCGVWTTSVCRTLVDLARLLPTASVVCAIDAALHRGLVTPADLERATQAHHGAAGAPAWRRAVSLADGRSESPAESLTRLLLLPDLPGLRPQHRLYDDRGGVVARFDLGDPETRFAVEADGRRGHVGERMVARDARRDRATQALGWRTERVTWWDLRVGAVATRARVLDAHRRHGAPQASRAGEGTTG